MKNKLNVGLLLENSLSNGGGYSYAHSILTILSKYNNKYNITVFTNEFNNLKTLRNMGLNPILVNVTLKSFIKNLLKEKKIAFGIDIKKAIKKYNIDLIHFLGPYSRWKEIESILPFIFTIHDIGHFELGFFPEYSGKEFWRRENVYRYGAIRAYRVIVDSDITKYKLTKYYGLPEYKIDKLNFTTYKHLIKSKKPTGFNQEERSFIIYPAQFWAHKNHSFLIESLSYSLKTGSNISLVLCGSDTGNLQYIRNLVSEYNLTKNVIFLGFITDSELNWLYDNAIAMVMPTYLSTTNIPPLEALLKDLPVIYPHNSYCGVDPFLIKYTINIDLHDTTSLDSALKYIINNKENISKLVYQAKMEMQLTSDEKRFEVIDSIWDDFARLRKTWN